MCLMVSLRAQWVICLLLPRHVGEGLGLILAPLLGVLVLNDIQDIHPPCTVTIRPHGKVEDVEIVFRVSIIHASH